MTGAMYAAIAGLRTHMQNLNVIGNNVANVNTYGYKSARSVFTTALYTSVSGGSDGTTVVGGANPSQIGYGANMGSIGIDMSTGNYAITGKSTDLMLDGDGFFMLNTKDAVDGFSGTSYDQDSLNGMSLTRVGNFQFGPDGYLAREDDGMCVYGFLCTGYDANGNLTYSDQLVPIRLPGIKTETDATTGETKVSVAYPQLCNADGTVSTTGKGTLKDVEQPVMGADGKPTTVTEPLPKARFTGITFDRNTGIITGTCSDTEQVVTIGIVAVGQVRNPNGVTNLGDNYYQAGEGSGGLSVALMGGATESIFGDEVFYMNQSKITDANAQNQNPDACRLRSAGKTGLLSNGLEMSKTDLAQEISQMILTQRGYQANTRIITVTDSMLEELVNMKR